ncbi:MAG: hypothetical protein D6725_01120 [Planctomycetota bacterium]|nr:MAG: hypothetical protein D6725_01120 [Planctomycetota bacterium]
MFRVTRSVALIALLLAGCQVHRCAHCRHIHGVNVFGGPAVGAYGTVLQPVPEASPPETFPPPPVIEGLPMPPGTVPVVPDPAGPQAPAARDFPEAPAAEQPRNAAPRRTEPPSDDVRIVPPAQPEPPPLPEPGAFLPSPSFPIADGPAS